MALGVGADWLPLGTPYKRHLAAGTMQLVLLTAVAGYLAAWWIGRRQGQTFEASKRIIWVAVIAGIILYATGLSALSLFRHRSLQTGIFDLGYYAQLSWELANFQVPRSSVRFDAVWGDHATFILAVVAPFLRLFSDPATLLVIQSIVLALGALPTFFLGRRVWGGHPLAGAVFAGAYLLYPPLQFSNLFDFHADIFATPILLTAFAALFAGRAGWALGWAALLIIVKEDMALVSLTFGLYVAVVHRRRGGLVLAAVAAGAFLLLVGVILPEWMHRPYFSHVNRWSHLGDSPWELLVSPLLRPAEFFGTLVQPERFGYLLLLVTPLAGLPLFAPEMIAIGLPPLASNLLSSVELQYTIRGHYTAVLTPILIAAAIVGGRRASVWLEGRGSNPAAVLAGLVATSMAASFAFSPLPWSQDPSARKHFWDAMPRPGLAAVLAHIGPESSVSVANHVGAHVALRRTFKMFPDGLDASDFVLVDVSGFDYIGPALDPETFRLFFRRLVETRPLTALAGGLALFDRGKPSLDAVPRLVNLRVDPALHGKQRAGFLSLPVVSIAPLRVAPRAFLRTHYTWIEEEKFAGVPCIAEGFFSSGDRPVWERRRPLFHGVLSGERWPLGGAADDDGLVVVPETVPAGVYQWVIKAWSDAGADPCREEPAGAPALPVALLRVDPW